MTPGTTRAGSAEGPSKDGDPAGSAGGGPSSAGSAGGPSRRPIQGWQARPFDKAEMPGHLAEGRALGKTVKRDRRRRREGGRKASGRERPRATPISRVLPSGIFYIVHTRIRTEGMCAGRAAQGTVPCRATWPKVLPSNILDSLARYTSLPQPCGGDARSGRFPQSGKGCTEYGGAGKKGLNGAGEKDAHGAGCDVFPADGLYISSWYWLKCV